MDRRNFFKNALGSGLLCCAAGTSFGKIIADASSSPKSLGEDLTNRMREGARSPNWLVTEKSQHWIKSMIDILDEQLDEQTKIKILNLCGKACFERAFGVADANKPSPEAAERLFKKLESNGLKVERGSKRTILYYGWQGKQNPMGLSLKEGYCLCHIVESDVPDLSPTYCSCSAGYVKEAIERGTGLEVIKVEVLESLKMGGKDCRFKVTLKNP
jgi:hypothetical protein